MVRVLAVPLSCSIQTRASVYQAVESCTGQGASDDLKLAVSYVCVEVL